MTETEKLRTALLKAFHELTTDYTSEVWGRDLQYIADALGLELEKMEIAAYCRSYEEFISLLPDIPEKSTN